MAKAQVLYAGSISSGLPVEAAKRADGVWFSREYGWNGYGRGWGKWKAMDWVPEHPKRVRYGVECADAPEYVEIPEAEREDRIEWGFANLARVPGPYSIRLPN